jgi:hypothetical protein
VAGPRLRPTGSLRGAFTAAAGGELREVRASAHRVVYLERAGVVPDRGGDGYVPVTFRRRQPDRALCNHAS